MNKQPEAVFFKAEEFERLKFVWSQIIPVVQNLHDTLIKYEIKPNLELLEDLIAGGQKARESYLKSVQEQINSLVSNSILRESLLMVDHSKVFNEMDILVREYHRIIENRFYNIPWDCFKITLCQLKKGIISISNVTFEDLKDKFFTIYVENEDQNRSMVLSKLITNQLEELIEIFQKRNPKGVIPIGSMETPDVLFSDLFIEHKGKFEFKIRTIQVLK